LKTWNWGKWCTWGNDQLLGEVVRVSTGGFTVQVYEDTGGLRPGEPVAATGRLLTAELGPGLLTTVFDGTQRPLIEVAEVSGPFVKRGVRVNALSRKAKWHFKPLVREGAKLSPGDLFGVVQETPLVEHKLATPFYLGRAREGGRARG